MKQRRDDFDLLCSKGEVSGPVDDAAVSGVEAELGVKFPTDYRELLRRYGAVVAPGVEVYGLLSEEANNDPPLWQEVVSVTHELREMKQIGAERREFVPISDNGTGVYFYLDTSKSPRTKIFAIGPGIEKAFDADLFSFFVDLSEGKVII